MAPLTPRIKRLTNEEKIHNLVKNIAVLDAIHLAASAWKSVSKSAIINCFRKGLGNDQVQESVHERFADVLSEVPTPPEMSREIFESQVDLEEDIDVQSSDEDDSDNDNPGEEPITEVHEENPVSNSEAIECLMKLQSLGGSSETFASI